ncbi:hypothetical protein HPB51_005609 [Rhipicephalus microplus]|uniref:Peptidase M13 N-terminal domain-containing protein n=1 Tax=Rhipicephalus microplus TaxID=6941 RepID=A0A9J6DTQ5_RHIMP|nr:hypothetical protein HPB51_005609 [Rhipicephalus microplus]
MVDKATNTILGETVPKTTKHSPVSSSVRRSASREHIAIIDQDNSSQDTSEETPNEETFFYRHDVTGAGETAEPRILGEGAELKHRKKNHHRSKTVMKDLIFSIRPRLVTGGGLMTVLFGKPYYGGAVADAMMYSATNFSYDGAKSAEQPAISEPRLTNLPHQEVSVDPFSASIPCSTENLICLPPMTETHAKRAPADDCNQMLNAKFAVVGSATQNYQLRRESSGTMNEVGRPRSLQCRKSANTLPTALGSGSNTYTITEATHPDYSVRDTINPENEQIRSLLLQAGEVNENEYRISPLFASEKDSVVLAEGCALKKEGKDEKSGTFCSSDSNHKNLFHVRPSFRRNLEPSIQKDTGFKENITFAGVFLDVKESDVQRERSAKAFSSLPSLEVHTANRTYGRCSPAGAISQSIVPENMLPPSSSNRMNRQVMPTQVFNYDAGPVLYTEEKPVDNMSPLFTRENAYKRRTSLTAISHTVMYQTYLSKQAPQLQTERRYLSSAAVDLNREAVLRELPTHGRSQDSAMMSLAREHEMQVKHSSSHATSGVELITSCHPSHSMERPHEACNVARKWTRAVTRGCRIMLDGVANRFNDNLRVIESFDSSLKSAVPAFSPVCVSKSAAFCDANVCEQVAQGITGRPIPHPRAINVSDREVKKKKLILDRAPHARKLSAGSTKGEPSDFRELDSKSIVADKVCGKHGRTQHRTQAVVDVRNGVDISDENCSFDLRKALTSNTNIQATSCVHGSGDTAVAGKISISSKALKMNVDSNGLPDISISLTANVKHPAERKEVSNFENDCNASVEVKAKNWEMILEANVAPDHLTIGKCEYSGNENVKTVDHCGLLGNEEVYTNAGVTPNVEISASLRESSRISRKSDRLLHTKIAVATVASLTCLVWIAEVYPTSRQEVPDILQIHFRNMTEPSYGGVTFETLWYTTGSKITTTTTLKPLTRSYLCSSDFCLQEAAYINGAINEDASPCDNFYQHVCSKWESKISLSAMALGVSASVDTVVDEYMSSMLTDYILLKKNEETRLPRFLYKTCMSTHRHSSAFIRSQVFSALPMRTWPFIGSMGSVEVWRTAGIIARKYGVTALLRVVVGTERTTNLSIVELELPRSLFFSGDESRPGVKRMFVEAIREVAMEFNQTSMAANLTTQIMEIFKGLSKVTDKPVTSRTCRARKLKHIDYSVRAFVTAVFNGDINPNTTVIVRNSDAILGGLVRFTHNLDVQHFLNYLGFRLLVRLALLLPEHLVNMRHLFSVEFTGRVVREDLKWLLCMRLAEAVAPPCLENVQATVFKKMKTLTLARRFWLLQMEDFFPRNLRHLAWISEKTLSFMEKKLNHYKFVHVSFKKTPRNDRACKSLRDLLASRRRLKKSQLVPALLATWETYQAMYLKQTMQEISPRDQGMLCESNPRLIKSLQTVFVPPGLVNVSVPENSTMLAFHLSRVATRLFRALVPLVSVEDGQCDGPSAMTPQSQRSLARLRKCLAKDAQSLPSQLQPRASEVLWDGEGQEGEETGFAILAQTAALGLAFAAFKVREYFSGPPQ